jgi:hypothetical protein
MVLCDTLGALLADIAQHREIEPRLAAARLESSSICLTGWP